MNIRRAHPVADALGAVLRGAREGDEHVRRRARGFLRWVLASGFAGLVALRLLQLTEEGIRRGWVQTDQQQLALVKALEEQTVSIDNLVWSMWELAGNGSAEHRAIMKRLGVPPPTPIVRPGKREEAAKPSTGGGVWTGP